MKSITQMPLNEKLQHLFSLVDEQQFDHFSFTCLDEMIQLFHLRQDFIPQQIKAHNTFYEAEFLHTLSFFWDAKGLIFDIGANIGNHTLWFAKMLGGSVWAFEPVDINALTLAVNLEMNHVDGRVRLFHLALDNKEGRLRMTMAKAGNMGTWSSIADTGAASINVPMIPLDVLLATEEPENPVSLMKIDVEGMELNVLQGASETIQRHKPVLALESATLEELHNIDGLLTSWGYFPVEVMNYTPTFIWLNRHSAFHMEKLAEYVRHTTLTKRRTHYSQ